MTREDDVKRLLDKYWEESKQQVEIDFIKYHKELFEDYPKWKKLLFRTEFTETEKAIFIRGWWFGFLEGRNNSVKLLKSGCL